MFLVRECVGGGVGALEKTNKTKQNKTKKVKKQRNKETKKWVAVMVELGFIGYKAQKKI